MRGRPTKLNKQLEAQICKLLRKGNYVETVCDYVGIPPERFYQWLKRNPEFREAVKKAMAEAEIKILAKIQRKVSNWQALAWFLERRYPNKWGNKTRLDVEHKGRIVIKLGDAKKLKGGKKNGDSN